MQERITDKDEDLPAKPAESAASSESRKCYRTRKTYKDRKSNEAKYRRNKAWQKRNLDKVQELEQQLKLTAK